MGTEPVGGVERIEGVRCRVIRSRRKSLALVVSDDAQLTVRAPYDLPYRVIGDFINEKKHWIAQKQRNAYTISRKYAPILFRDGEYLPYCGRHYRIALAAVGGPRISGMTILIPERRAKEEFTSWMKEQALETLTARVAYYAGAMRLNYGKVRISSARMRWGSCSAVDDLNFTWRLLMCPQEVLDYVVVHELSHVSYKNHGSDFWALVEKNCPDYRTHQNWLKENRRILDIIS